MATRYDQTPNPLNKSQFNCIHCLRVPSVPTFFSEKELVNHIIVDHESDVFGYLVETSRLDMTRAVFYPCDVCGAQVPWDYLHIGKHKNRFHPDKNDMKIIGDSMVFKPKDLLLFPKFYCPSFCGQIFVRAANLGP